MYSSIKLNICLGKYNNKNKGWRFVLVFSMADSICDINGEHQLTSDKCEIQPVRAVRAVI